MSVHDLEPEEQPQTLGQRPERERRRRVSAEITYVRARPTLPFGRLRRERLIDDSVRACVDLSKVRLDKYGFLMVSGLDVEAVQAEYARRASL
ncbi:MAG: hypothetical protein KGL35_05225 [Bradyrhizobium sp.]|nr:hypothetical protein [Bradyrhizobium sp.]